MAPDHYGGDTGHQARRSRKERICEPTLLVETQAPKDLHTRASSLCPWPLSLPGSWLPSAGSATPRRGDSLAQKPGFELSLGRHRAPSLNVIAL